MGKSSLSLNVLYKKVSMYWLGWVLWLCFLAIIAPRFLPYLNQSANYTVQLESRLPIWIEKWANFDGGAYIMIAKVGYEPIGFIQAYFPGFPLLLRTAYSFLNLITNVSVAGEYAQFILVGWGINILLSLLVCLVFSKYLMHRGFKLVETQLVLAVFLLFPVSFFLISIYTESLFLLMVIGSFYFYQRKKFIWLAITLFMASSTRVVGIFLIPAIGLDILWSEYEQSTRKFSILFQPQFWVTHFKKYWQYVLSSLVGAAGLLSYMGYLFYLKNDPLYFFHVQSEFGAGREERIILLPQVIWRYMKILWTVRPIDVKYYAYVQEFGLSMVVLALLIYGFWYMKKLRVTVAELSFSALAFILPTLTGNFSSMPRYIIVCLPIYVIIASIVGRYRWFYLVCMFTWLSINTILFIQGRWIG